MEKKREKTSDRSKKFEVFIASSYFIIIVAEKLMALIFFLSVTPRYAMAGANATITNRTALTSLTVRQQDTLICQILWKKAQTGWY